MSSNFVLPFQDSLDDLGSSKIPYEFNGERTVFSTKGAVKIGYSYAKDRSWTFSLHHIEKLTEIDQILHLHLSTEKDMHNLEVESYVFLGG